ncbi:endonuclease/exonuclease/phosphatase family protein [Marinimicrobium sp. C6131]|uniref:endonuclease/exonuclease/phosphatase family protein n=1 Tax=Marinimicrobium sp. C6131 TaxID=3022676 RepID=UPI00223D1068|nr:endonuclease/exonuclease/phosphatase family protein [Marinimicrobium sp. C6131]UZJ45001.1 endonuclease/exonuclease/phosphatase family protein [Marinimicrobium sp. C6131]
MIGRVEVFFRRLRRNLSRSLWLSRLLKLPVSEGSPNRPGLIMVQVDGLSQRQFERALAKGELPFLRRLLQREHYRVHPHYSGLPSSTPAVQAELFYGVKGAVPAFSFRDRDTGKRVSMFDADAATKVQERCASEEFEPLLKAGSAYVDNYTGGASEAHFCATSVGWGPALRSANPLVLIAFLCVNFYSFLRMLVLFFTELGLSLVDAIRGVTRGQDIVTELKFIPARVGITILLRELCVIGGKIDIVRGLPVIHINFLGYDEQAHRRGPGSLFAHWTLKGIDDAISRLWHAAHHAPWRHYDLWVYSDHGQSHATNYHEMQGYSLKDAVVRAAETLALNAATELRTRPPSKQGQRARVLGGRRVQRWFSVLGINGDEVPAQHWVVSALGPVGHAYSPVPLSDRERVALSHELVHTHRVSAVLTVMASGSILACTAQGELSLPEDSARLFGAGHPFVAVMGDDLVRLCRHKDAGDLVLLGWCDGAPSLTFAQENGAHGGVAPEETGGFALLPRDVPLRASPHPFLRPLDLREAALRLLGRAEPHATTGTFQWETPKAESLRVMTYNVHSCIGMDGKVDTRRIARVIAQAQPDVVALQELDVGKARSFGKDQAHLIARHLDMDFHFHPVIHLEEELYGDAILTRLPLRLIKAGPLPGLEGNLQREPRGALWVAVEFRDREIQIINTHLGLSVRERGVQVDALLGREWLSHADCQGPVILCGDFNAMPSSAVYRQLAARFKDVQTQIPGLRPRGTFFSRFPQMRLDHIFISDDLAAVTMTTIDSQLARTASDHLPLVAEVLVSGRP